MHYFWSCLNVLLKFLTCCSHIMIEIQFNIASTNLHYSASVKVQHTSAWLQPVFIMHFRMVVSVSL